MSKGNIEYPVPKLSYLQRFISSSKGLMGMIVGSDVNDSKCWYFLLTPSLSAFACELQNVGTLRGAEGGEVDCQTLRKSSSSRSSRKSFRLDYRLEVKLK